MPFGIGVPELAILLVLVIVIFGVGRLPELGGAVGKSIRQFRSSVKEDPAALEKTSSADK